MQCFDSRDDSANRRALDAMVRMTGDLRPLKGANLGRLRALTAAAAMDDDDTIGRRLPLARYVSVEADPEEQEALAQQLAKESLPSIGDLRVLDVKRRDAREMLLEGRLVDGLSWAVPSERLGPFLAPGGVEVWFDLFYSARKITVTAGGGSAPDLILTQARPPQSKGGKSSIDIEAGTVWVRGGLFGGALPGGAYVGLRVEGGSLLLDGPISTTGDDLVVAPGLDGELLLSLAEDGVAPVPGACEVAQASVDLPSEIKLVFQAGSLSVESKPGAAKAWGQSFSFNEPNGAVDYVEPLWTLVLGYGVAPDSLDTAAIQSELWSPEGKALVAAGGLGLPVVAPGDPASLGEVARSADWWLRAEGFEARWYDAGLSRHALAKAWIGISDRGVLLLAEGIEPLSPPLRHGYALWEIRDGDGQRLPWEQEYAEPFLLTYRCDVVEGEHLLVTGMGHVDLDRPVEIDGGGVGLRKAPGALALHRMDGVTTLSLAALGATPGATSTVERFALRNALVWSSGPVFLFAQGVLSAPGKMDGGSLLALLGVYGWTPTLPDPYVSNLRIPPKGLGGENPVRALLVAQVRWDEPQTASVSFHGNLGTAVAAEGLKPSPAGSRPAQGSETRLDSLTQTQAGKLYLDKAQGAAQKAAQAKELQQRDERLQAAENENQTSQKLVDGFLGEVLGAAPKALLLDVSTHQDLLGVAIGVQRDDRSRAFLVGGQTTTSAFPVQGMAVHAPLDNLRVVTLPQVQWEPVRTLDSDQDIFTLGWFPTPLASPTDGGPTQLGARSQTLAPMIPGEALESTVEAYAAGTPVAFRTTLPFGLVAAVQLIPSDQGDRKADLYGLTQPEFPEADARGGYQVTALAEGGREDAGGVSPWFQGRMRQWINGVDLPSGAPLGLSVLGSTAGSAGSVETVFNNDMAANPKVPVTRFDLSGYGGSNFSEWNNPFAAYAEAAKVQFRFMVGRTALEVIKVNSVLHPWGIRVTRSVTVERRAGGGVIRRDSGWQAFTPGLFDYRYFDTGTSAIEVAPYEFDAGVFEGLFDVRSIRPAPGSPVSVGGATLVPYYFDAELALDGLGERTAATGMLGYLQTEPNGSPATEVALQTLLETQGAVGGPIDATLDFGGSGLPFRARRLEIGLAMDGPKPIFVATLRGSAKLPTTGAWSTVTRPLAGVPAGGGEAVCVPDSKGVPLIRRYPVKYSAGTTTTYSSPPLAGPASTKGDYRLADAADLLVPLNPANEYGLLQSTPTHAFLFPRPHVSAAGGGPLLSSGPSALADIIARSTSKGAFPPPENALPAGAAALQLDVGPGGTLALPAKVSVVNYPNPLRLSGTAGHGAVLDYSDATLELDLQHDSWAAEFTGLEIWSDISGLERLSGSRMRIVGSTQQRSQVAESQSLMLEEIEEILRYIPLFGNRGVQGPIDLGASNEDHELKLEICAQAKIPPIDLGIVAGAELTLTLFTKASSGFDLATGGVSQSAVLGAELEGKVPLLTVGVASVFLIVVLGVEFSITSVSGAVTEEALELLAFVGIGVEGRIGPFNAYAFLGVGFVLVYEISTDTTKYGGLVALEAGIDLTVVKVKLRAELQGLVYDDVRRLPDGSPDLSTGSSVPVTAVDCSGKVKLEVNLFLIISISATYTISDRKEL